jgi:hypothetical protein
MALTASTTILPILARGRAEGGRGGFFQHLLVAALQRAVAFAEVNHIAVAVGDDLDLDVARLLEVALHIDRVIAERGASFRAGGRDRLGQVFAGLGDLHAATAAAGGRLDQYGEADHLGGREGLFLGGDAAVRAGNHRNAGVLDGLLGSDLVTHEPDMLGLGTDEGEAVGVDDLGEAGVFRQEAVAGVDRLGAGDLGRRR